MSAFIMDLNRIAALAEFIDTLNFNGFGCFGFSIPESLSDALELTKRSENTREIFNKLYMLNVEAVNGRYNSEESTAAEMPRTYKSIAQVSQWDCNNSIYIIESWHYELFKLLQCFLYQCCEDATINSALYKGLKDLENTFAHFIVVNNTLYTSATWG